MHPLSTPWIAGPYRAVIAFLTNTIPLILFTSLTVIVTKSHEHTGKRKAVQMQRGHRRERGEGGREKREREKSQTDLVVCVMYFTLSSTCIINTVDNAEASHRQSHLQVHLGPVTSRGQAWTHHQLPFFCEKSFQRFLAYNDT